MTLEAVNYSEMTVHHQNAVSIVACSTRTWDRS